MSAEGRWIRLQCNYLFTEWLEELGYPFNRLWPDVLTHVKLNGNNRGATKAVSAKTLARLVAAPESDVQKMLDSALVAGALIIEDGRWIVASWADYQSPDAERKRTERTAPSSYVPDNADLSRTSGTRPVSCHATLTETETLTKTEGDTPLPPSPTAPEKTTTARVMPRPSREDVAAYFRESKRSGEDARRFWNYYEANGWKAGRVPMKNWHRAADNWRDEVPGNGRASPNHGESISEVLAKNPWRQKPQDPEVQAIGQ